MEHTHRARRFEAWQAAPSHEAELAVGRIRASLFDARMPRQLTRSPDRARILDRGSTSIRC